MISKNQIKFIKSLSIKKYRDQNQQAVLEGYRLIEESIKSNVDIKYIYCTEKNYNKISNNELFHSVEFFLISDNECKALSDTKHSQGIVALIDIKNVTKEIIQSALSLDNKKCLYPFFLLREDFQRIFQK